MDDTRDPNGTIEADSNETDDVVPVYANNVRFEMTAWDLRILFGQLMPLREGRGHIDWHTDVTVPWAQAKLMHLYLGMNITLYERENGSITVPTAVLPAPIDSPPEGVDPSNSDSIETFKIVQRLIQEFRDRQASGK